MATIKSSMTTAEINTCLKNNREVTFKAGNYNLTKALTVYSNTNVICEDGVVFNRIHAGRMLQFYVDKETTKYNGTHDCSWTGGKFIADTNSDKGIVICLMHCRNITLKDITIDGCVELHSIECNSSKNVKIDNCTIMNQSLGANGENFREAIQIDFAYKAGLNITGATATSHCYDATHCKDIYISNCTFKNCPNGIGTHTIYDKEMYHTNINIEDCEFEKIKKNGIRLLGMKDVIISGCDTKIVVDKKKEAHTLSKKINIANYRYNQNVSIDEYVIVK